nr:siderophore-interacting protein [Motilibacter aurantiacus]
MVGDASALPAIGCRIEEAAPQERVVAVVEVDGPHDEQQPPAGPAVPVTWAHRTAAALGVGSPLLDAVRALDLPAGDFFAFVAAEAGTVRAVRDHLLAERARARSGCGRRATASAASRTTTTDSPAAAQGRRQPDDSSPPGGRGCRRAGAGPGG